MTLIDKYLGEAKLEDFVKVIDKKTGKTITTLDTKKFMETMKDFKNFKFVKDAIDFYNKQYKDYHATLEIRKKN
jgi:hypothetical protein